MPWFQYLSMQGSLAKGWIFRDGGANRTWKVSDYTEGLTGLPERLCSKEGKVGDGFFFVISISRWNQMHIGSTP